MTSTPFPISYREIVEDLNSHAAAIAMDVLINPKREGNEISGDLDGPCSIVVTGQKTGLVGFWVDQGPGKSPSGGNLIHAVELAKGFNTHGEAVRYCKAEYLNIHDDNAPRPTRNVDTRLLENDGIIRAEAQAKAGRILQVRELWSQGRAVAGTPAEIYLENRGLARIDWPPSLRYHPGLNVQVDDSWITTPALIGGVQAADKSLISVWRILLNADGVPLRDAHGKKVKKGFGPAKGGAVRLAAATDHVAICEGIETGLAIRELEEFKLPVWACLSTSGLINFDPPERIRSVTIYADGDRAKEVGRPDNKKIIQPGRDAAEKARERLEGRGVQVDIIEPPAGSDFLDALNSVKRGAAGYGDRQAQLIRD